MISQLTLQVNTAGIAQAQTQMGSLAQAVASLSANSTINVGGFAQMSVGMQGAATAGSALSATLGNIGGAAQAGVAAFQQLKAAVDGATSALMQMGQEGAQISQLGLAFDQIGGSAKRMGELRDLTGGIVDDVALKKAFNMATLFDIPKDKIPAMLKAAQGASIAMGISAEKAVNDVLVAIARRSKPIADNIGVQIGNLTTVYENFAAKAGKSVKQLTEEEKSLAFTNVFLEKSTRQMSLAGAAQANVYAQMSAQATNAENEFKVFVSQMLAGSGALDFVSSTIKTMKEAMEGAPTGVLQGAMKTLFATGMQLGKMLVPVFTAAVPVITLALDVFNLLAPAITATLGVASKITQGLVLAVRIGMLPFLKALDLTINAVRDLADTVGVSTPTLDGMSAGIDQFVNNTSAMFDAASGAAEIHVKPEAVIEKTAAEKFAASASTQLQAQLKAMERDAQVVLALTVKPEVAEDQTGMGNAVALLGEGGMQNVLRFREQALQKKMQAEMFGSFGEKSAKEAAAEMAKWDQVLSEQIAFHAQRLKGEASTNLQQTLGAGLNEGLILAATQSSAAAAELLGGMGADISGATEQQLIAASSALYSSAREGKIAAGLKGAAAGFVQGIKGGFGANAVSELRDALGTLSSGLTGSGISGGDLIKFGSVAKGEAAGGLKLFTGELRAVSGEVPKFNSAVSDMNKGLQEAFGESNEKDEKDYFKNLFKDMEKFGLVRTETFAQKMTMNDIEAFMEYQDSVVALSDSGEVLTGEQAILTNAIRKAGGEASGAVGGLEAYRKTLVEIGDAIQYQRVQAEAAGKPIGDLIAKQERAAAQLAVADKALAAAKAQAEKDKKDKGSGKKKDDGKQALRERAEMIGLEDFEKARLAAERVLAKDMKTAGADPALKDAARKIYADAVGKPALDELARIGGAMAGMTTQIGGMIAASGKALFSNPEVADMIKASRANLLKAGLSMQTVDLGGGRSRKRTEQEVNAQIELIALEKEWAAKKEILQEGSEAYLVVMSDYLLKKKDLEGQLKTQQEESILSALAGFEGVFGAVQGTFDSLMESGTVGEQAVASLSGTVLMLGQDMAGMADQFKGIDEAMAKGSITSGQAEVQKANAIVGAAGRAAAGVIKNERARAFVQGAVEVALAASSFAIGDIAGGIAHSAAAALFFTASGRGSGGTAAARNITPRRSAAGSDRGSSAGDRRQAQTQVNIYLNPITGRAIVDSVNRDSARQAGLAFNGRVMQGAARRPEL